MVPLVHFHVRPTLSVNLNITMMATSRSSSCMQHRQKVVLCAISSQMYNSFFDMIVLLTSKTYSFYTLIVSSKCSTLTSSPPVIRYIIFLQLGNLITNPIRKSLQKPLLLPSRTHCTHHDHDLKLSREERVPHYVIVNKKSSKTTNEDVPWPNPLFRCAAIERRSQHGSKIRRQNPPPPLLEAANKTTQEEEPPVQNAKVANWHALVAKPRRVAKYLFQSGYGGRRRHQNPLPPFSQSRQFCQVSNHTFIAEATPTS